MFNEHQKKWHIFSFYTVEKCITGGKASLLYIIKKSIEKAFS